MEPSPAGHFHQTCQLPGRLEELERLNAAIESACAHCRFSVIEEQQLLLVCEEVFANIIAHGYEGKLDGQVHVSLEFANDRLRLEFVDEGVPFDPLLRAEPDVSAELDDRQIGGLGIFLVRRIADEATYKRIDGKNVLTLVKLRQNNGKTDPGTTDR